jgi:Ca2+-dependent lipid-binding protein
MERPSRCILGIHTSINHRKKNEKKKKKEKKRKKKKKKEKKKKKKEKKRKKKKKKEKKRKKKKKKRDLDSALHPPGIITSIRPQNWGLCPCLQYFFIIGPNSIG